MLHKQYYHRLNKSLRYHKKPALHEQLGIAPLLVPATHYAQLVAEPVHVTHGWLQEGHTILLPLS